MARLARLKHMAHLGKSLATTSARYAPPPMFFGLSEKRRASGSGESLNSRARQMTADRQVLSAEAWGARMPSWSLQWGSEDDTTPSAPSERPQAIPKAIQQNS